MKMEINTEKARKLSNASGILAAITAAINLYLVIFNLADGAGFSVIIRQLLQFGAMGFLAISAFEGCHRVLGITGLSIGLIPTLAEISLIMSDQSRKASTFVFHNYYYYIINGILLIILFTLTLIFTAAVRSKDSGKSGAAAVFKKLRFIIFVSSALLLLFNIVSFFIFGGIHIHIYSFIDILSNILTAAFLFIFILVYSAFPCGIGAEKNISGLKGKASAKPSFDSIPKTFPCVLLGLGLFFLVAGICLGEPESLKIMAIISMSFFLSGILGLIPALSRYARNYYRGILLLTAALGAAYLLESIPAALIIAAAGIYFLYVGIRNTVRGYK